MHFWRVFGGCLLLLFQSGVIFGEITMKEVIDEYLPEYCHSLEAVYGKGMMSEGGAKAVDVVYSKGW
jgi:hypothetical protein